MLRTFHGCSCRGEQDTFSSFGILPEFAYLCPNKKTEKHYEQKKRKHDRRSMVGRKPFILFVYRFL